MKQKKRKIIPFQFCCLSRQHRKEVDSCNDLFSRFEQQTSILEKQAEATDQTTICHGHNGPSQGLVSKHLENLKLGTENQVSEIRNEMAGRTVTGVTDSHRVFSGNPVSNTCDDLQDGPSQARRAVTGCVNPSLSWNSSMVLRDVFDYSCFDYKVSGLMLTSLITWGFKELTLS